MQLRMYTVRCLLMMKYVYVYMHTGTRKVILEIKHLISHEIHYEACRKRLKIFQEVKPKRKVCDYERRKQNEAIILKDTQSIRSPKIERKRIGKRGKIFF